MLNTRTIKARELRTGQVILLPFFVSATVTATAKWNHHGQVMVTLKAANGQEQKHKFYFDDEVIILS